MTAWTRRLGWTGAAAALLLSAGCGEDARVLVGAAALSQAASTTGETSYEFTMTSSVDAGAETVAARGSGRRSGDRTDMTVELPTAAGRWSMRIVSVDGRSFLRYDGVPSGVGLPDGWIELTGAASTSGLTSASSVGDFLEAFERPVAPVVDLGERPGDDAAVHRYRTTVDLSSTVAVETSNRTMRRVLDAMAESMRSVRVTVDVDGRGRIVRLAYAQRTAMGTNDVEMRISGFGEPVGIDPPSGATVMTVDELAGLTYPEASGPGADVDPAVLPTREDFVAGAAGAGIDEELVGCIYDELVASRPHALLGAGSDTATDDAKAIAAASMICGVASPS